MSREEISRSPALRAVALVTVLALVGCNDQEPVQPPPPPVTIGGVVSGLAGGAVTLNLNGSEPLVASSNSSFTFNTQQPAGTAWSVSMTRKPLAQNCTLSNSSGTANGTPVTNVTVTCGMRAWRAAETFGAEAGAFQQRPIVAIDAQGTAIIASKQLRSQFAYAGRLQVAERSASGAWTPISGTYIDSSAGDGSHFVFGYDLAAAGSGHAFIAWEEVQVTDARFIMVSRRTGVGSWSSPVRIDSGANAAPVGPPDVAVSADGSAIAVWPAYDFESDATTVYTSRYVAASGWSAPQRLESATGTALSPRVAMDADGNGAVVWLKGDDGQYRVLGASYRAGTGWTDPVELNGGNTVGAGHARIAMGANGNAIAVWVRFNSETLRGSAAAARFTLANGWSAAPTELISPSEGYVAGVNVAINATGSAFVSMDHVAAGSNAFSTRAARFTPAGGWEVPSIVTEGRLFSDVAVDADGNGTVVFTSSSLGARRYLASGPNSGWMPVDEDIDSFATGQANDPRIAVAPDGSALVVFSQLTSTAPNSQTPNAVRLD